MKGLVLTASAVGLLVAGSIASAGPCSVATLHGTMAYATTYQNAGTLRTTSGIESYDGRGHMRYYQLVGDGYTTSTYTGTGTYTMAPNCIALVTYDGAPTPYQYFVAQDGSAYFWSNNQNTGVTSAGKAERISLELLVN